MSMAWLTYRAYRVSSSAGNGGVDRYFASASGIPMPLAHAPGEVVAAGVAGVHVDVAVYGTPLHADAVDRVRRFVCRGRQRGTA